MSETAPSSKGPAPAQYKPAATEPALIPADQVKPEDIATLSIEYRDGQPVMVVSGGTYIPAALPVLTGDGTATSYFQSRIRYLDGGVETGFHHVEPEKYRPRSL